MVDLPTGTVTFLFTDIEGSIALWERDRAAMREAVARHLAILQSLINAHYGVLYKTIGDGTQAAFASAEDALRAALASQRALLAEAWVDPPGPVRVRMALHTAAAVPQDGDYLASGLNRLARLLAAGHGGQVLLSLATQELARDALPAGAGLRDLGEHPLRDLYRPERVFQLLHPSLPADFPSLRTLATRPNNLPLQSTPFLGREEQVANVVDLLRRDAIRLLTITGPGGVGKTRLALQVAADVLEDFPDGVWFVDLGPLDEPGLVAAAVGGVLGVREGDVTEARLSAAVGDKRLLLVLDNFERLLAAAPLASAFLMRTPHVKMLVTSRIPLHAYGEQEYPLLPLPLPDLAHLPSLERLSQYEAVRLFVSRAQAVKPDFTVTNGNAPAVAEICHRLDGLPLAIELAAARIKVLPPQALLKRLEQRLPLLTGGAQTLPARQQTMRDTIAWSHDLLSAEQRTVFRRLAVFAGGCTIDAAEAVAGAEGGLDVFSIMAALVDESLLRQEEGLEGEPRFRMLETIREYGLERLEASGEGDDTRAKHAAYFCGLAERASSGLRSSDELRWYAALEAEQGNVRAALGWLFEGDPGSALSLTAALGVYWYGSNRYGEGRRWLERALALSRPTPPSVPRLDALQWAGLLAHYQGDRGRAAEFLAEGLEGARALGDAPRTAQLVDVLGIVAEDTGDYDRAASLLEEALTRYRSLGNRYEEALVLVHLGIVAYGQGDLARAEAQCLGAVALTREVGNETARMMAPLVLGHVATAAERLAQAAGWYRIVLAVLKELNAPFATWEHAGTDGIARTLPGVALLAMAQGEAVRAARLFGMAEAARAPIGLVPALPESAVYDRAMEAARHALGEAAFAAAYGAGRDAAPDQALAEVESVLADADRAEG